MSLLNNCAAEKQFALLFRSAEQFQYLPCVAAEAEYSCDSFKWEEGRFRLEIRMKCFTLEGVKPWNKLSREIVDAPSMKVFKARQNGAWSNWESGRSEMR